MTTNQPQWKQVGTVGDVNPFDYDGGFIYQDETGVYAPELEYILGESNYSQPENTGRWKVYRFCLDRLETVTVDGNQLLVPFGFGSRTDLPHPIDSYNEWFNRDLDGPASGVGITVEQYRAELCSEDARARAFAYLELAMYHGFENFDDYPLTFTNRDELEARYAQKAGKA
jgi:hypothetical protein